MTIIHNLNINMGIAERKAREFKRREKEILAAASNLFIKYGPHAATIEMIARDAEIGKGTIYKHFESKYEIYAVILIEHYEKLLQLVRKNIDKKASLVDQAKQYIKTVLTYIEKNKAYRYCQQSKQLLLTEHLSKGISEKLNALYQQDNDLLEEIIQQGVEAGLVITDLSVKDLVEIATGMCYGAFDAVMEMEITDKGKMYDLIADILLNAFIRR